MKYGGNALAGASSEADGLAEFAADVVLMHSVGMRPVVVHGGGPQIGEMLKQVGKESTFVDGLRVTDAETLDIVRMVLVGKVNREIVAAINVHGPLAVGVSGEDASLLTAKRSNADTGLRRRGHRRQHRHRHAADGRRTHSGHRDRSASTATARPTTSTPTPPPPRSPRALDAEKLVYLTDIDGIRRDVADADVAVLVGVGERRRRARSPTARSAAG